jgi:hypothetical protein
MCKRKYEKKLSILPSLTSMAEIPILLLIFLQLVFQPKLQTIPKKRHIIFQILRDPIGSSGNQRNPSQIKGMGREMSPSKAGIHYPVTATTSRWWPSHHNPKIASPSAQNPSSTLTGSLTLLVHLCVSHGRVCK